MFRLEDRQLHILTGLLFVASILLFLVFGISKMPEQKFTGETKGMTDFSEAWVCTYKTEDEEKLKANPADKSQKITGNGRVITEIVNLPADIPVMEDQKVTLSHKVPDIGLEKKFLTFRTKKQKVLVRIGSDVVYESVDSDANLNSFHIISVPRDYTNMVITIELTGDAKEQMKISEVQEGTYNELCLQAFLENGIMFLTGCVLVLISICTLLVWFLAKNTARQKKLLAYSSLEGLIVGLLFLTESRIVQIFINWNYGLYFTRVCLMVILIVFHLLVLRLFVYKKKILFAFDIGILAYGVFYVSVMVLQAFSLVQFDLVYLVEKILFVIAAMVFTILLFASMSGHERKEGRMTGIANIGLFLGILLPLLMQIFGRQKDGRDVYICIGFLFYMILNWIYGMKLSLQVQQAKADGANQEEAIRAAVIEKINPNLLFAAFQTLQNLIKNGSASSVKMIYYISVYLRGNLKALEQENEIIPFEEELEHIIAYLQLQKTRNSNLAFSIECKAKDFVVPRHSIQPMVENAVKYGIAGSDNKGNVVIRTYERKEGYAIQIIDDGAGFDTKILRQNSPTALLTLFAKLEKICGAKTEIISKEGKGTVITLVLPMLENDLIEEE